MMGRPTPATICCGAGLTRIGGYERCVLEENGGVSAARNAAIRVACAEFVAYPDQDDEYHPDYLAQDGKRCQEPLLTQMGPFRRIRGWDEL